jgi:hypothetical protein
MPGNRPSNRTQNTMPSKLVSRDPARHGSQGRLAEPALAVAGRASLALGGVRARQPARVLAAALADGAGRALEHARAGAAAAGRGGVVLLLQLLLGRVALLVAALAAGLAVLLRARLAACARGNEEMGVKGGERTCWPGAPGS